MTFMVVINLSISITNKFEWYHHLFVQFQSLHKREKKMKVKNRKKHHGKKSGGGGVKFKKRIYKGLLGNKKRENGRRPKD